MRKYIHLELDGKPDDVGCFYDYEGSTPELICMLANGVFQISKSTGLNSELLLDLISCSCRLLEKGEHQ